MHNEWASFPGVLSFFRSFFLFFHLQIELPSLTGLTGGWEKEGWWIRVAREADYWRNHSMSARRRRSRRRRRKREEVSKFRMIIYARWCTVEGLDKTLSRFLSGSSAKCGEWRFCKETEHFKRYYEEKPPSPPWTCPPFPLIILPAMLFRLEEIFVCDLQTGWKVNKCTSGFSQWTEIKVLWF